MWPKLPSDAKSDYKVIPKLPQSHHHMRKVIPRWSRSRLHMIKVTSKWPQSGSKVTFIRQKWLTLGSLWCHFGITLMSLWGHFGIISGSLCGHFGVTLGLHFLWSWECMDLSTWLMAVDPYPWTPTWAHGWQVHGFPVSFFLFIFICLGGNHEVKSISSFSAGITKWNQFLPSRRESRSEINKKYL